MGQKLSFKKKSNTAELTDLFDSIDEKRFPNAKGYLRGVRNYHILKQYRKVMNAFVFKLC